MSRENRKRRVEAKEEIRSGLDDYEDRYYDEFGSYGYLGDDCDDYPDYDDDYPYDYYFPDEVQKAMLAAGIFLLEEEDD